MDETYNKNFDFRPYRTDVFFVNLSGISFRRLFELFEWSLASLDRLIIKYFQAGALEGAQFLATNELKNISMQNLLDCSKVGNCKGGHYAIAFQYAIKNGGINLLSDYPYENAVRTYIAFLPSLPL